MELSKDLTYIKKYYGEEMMKICRDYLPSLLGEEGKVPQLLDEHFAHNKFLGEDIIQQGLCDKFQNYMYFFNKKADIIETNKTPEELFEEAGYILTECLTEADIQSFRKYYYNANGTPEYLGGRPQLASGEEICTFSGNRLSHNRVFFAVKKDIDKIKREDFQHPTRQDAYGTSCLSIQYSRKNGELSIKNRYNYTVHNPDNTFDNNLDNIMPGLAYAMAKKYNLYYSKCPFELKSSTYVYGGDNKLYKYNLEHDNIFYCINNEIINHNDGTMIKLPTDRYVLMENYVIDTQESVIMPYSKLLDGDKDTANLKTGCKTADILIDGWCEARDKAFIKAIGQVKKISIKTDQHKNRVICIQVSTGDDVLLTIDKKNRLIAYTNKNVKQLEDYFLYNFPCLQVVDLPNVEIVGNNCFSKCDELETINMKKVTGLGCYCFNDDLVIKTINLPMLDFTGNNCFNKCYDLQKVITKNARFGKGCFLDCYHMSKLDKLKCVVKSLLPRTKTKTKAQEEVINNIN